MSISYGYLFLLLLNIYASTAREFPVYDRDQFSIRKYPFMLNVKSTWAVYPKSICGGILVHPKFLVVQAHCIAYCEKKCWMPQNRVYYVHGGTASKSYGRRILKRIAKYYLHPQYEERHYIHRCKLFYDIAILQLEDPFRFSRRVAKAVLPEAVAENSTWENGEITDAINNRRRCTGIGWMNKSLVETNLYLIGTDTCIKMSALNRAYSQNTGGVCADTVICTIAPDGQDTAGSALALMCDTDMYGLLSWSSPITSPVKYNVYLRLDVCRKWIDSIILENRGSNLYANYFPLFFIFSLIFFYF